MDNNGFYEETFSPRRRLGSALSAINSMRLVANGGTSTNTLSLDSTGNLVFTGDSTTERMRITGGGNVGIGTTTPGSALDIRGTLRLSGSTSGFVGFAPAAAAGGTTYTLPSADGTSNQVLSTNGSGVLSWISVLSSAVTSSGWVLAGNSTTDAWNGSPGSGSFLGTTSAQPLVLAATNATAQDIRFFTGAGGANERMRILGNGNIGIGTATPQARLDVNGGIRLGNDTSSCTSSNIGTLRYNNGGLQLCRADGWANNLQAGTLAIGGDTTTDIIVNNDIYRVHTFTTVGTSSLNVIQGGHVEYLVVGGGGGGGGSQETPAGAGGGAGGLIYNSSYPVTPGLTYTVTVGAGGTGGVGRAVGSKGGNSVFGELTAIGGGGGGFFSGPASSGGSGGGSAWCQGLAGAGAGTAGQGFAGGNHNCVGNHGVNQAAAGGGGAGAVGGTINTERNGAAGGIGLQFGISGTQQYYAGGGGGGGGYGDTTPGTAGSGGTGGGGNGGAAGTSGNPGSNGTANTGGGGGGAGGDNPPPPYVSRNGGNGGSGIVIVRYKLGT